MGGVVPYLKLWGRESEIEFKKRRRRRRKKKKKKRKKTKKKTKKKNLRILYPEPGLAKTSPFS